MRQEHLVNEAKNNKARIQAFQKKVESIYKGHNDKDNPFSFEEADQKSQIIVSLQETSWKLFRKQQASLRYNFQC